MTQPPYPAPPGYPAQPYPQPYPPAQSYPGQPAAPAYPPAAPGYAPAAPAAPPAPAHPGAQPLVAYPTTQAPPPGYPGAPARQGLPAHPGAGQVPACRVCGCVPTADVTFRAHRGMIILMQFRRKEGPFCRDCGLAIFRQMTAESLIQGWWGYASSVINTVTVLINLARRGKVANLPAPQPPADGRPYRRPLDPGQPLYARPAAVVGALLPFVAVLVFVALIASSG